MYSQTKFHAYISRCPVVWVILSSYWFDDICLSHDFIFVVYKTVMIYSQIIHFYHKIPKHFWPKHPKENGKYLLIVAKVCLE